MLSFYHFTGDGRKLAANMRGVGLTPQDIPEWKKHITGGAKASYGKKEKKSLLEQRQSLPIYKLKEELVKVCHFQQSTSNIRVCRYLNWSRFVTVSRVLVISEFADI